MKLGTQTRFAFASALVLGLVLGLVWAMAAREGSIRQLYKEYEAFRASSSLLEALQSDSSLVPSDEFVLGFGVYDEEGKPIARLGSAPESLAFPAPSATPAYDRSRGTMVIQRLVGPGNGGMTGMRGMMNQGRRVQGQRAPGTLLPGAQGGAPGLIAAARPRVIWLEYGLLDLSRSRNFIFGGAILATVALAALYIVLLGLFRKNAELRAREASSRELVQLGEAARTLVHEIKNPLGVIRIQAASLKRLEGPLAAEKAAARAELIEDEVLRLAGLADRIREFLKGGEGTARRLELGGWLREFATRYAAPCAEGGDGASRDGSAYGSGESRGGIADGEGAPCLSLGELAEGAFASVDPDRLALALDNLVRNASEAAPGSAELSLARRGKAWEIRVADRGPGVSPESQGRLFEPFFTTKERGSGIGLALARRIARAAGGDVEYRSRDGGGSVFALALPSASKGA